MNTTNLTARQRKFADEYLLTGNAKQSAITAGYSEATSEVQGSRLLRNDKVRAYINKYANKASDDKIASANEIMELYTAILRGEVKETVIIGTLEGIRSTEKEADIKTRIIAGKELMKRYPGSDDIVKAQLRKLEAEADIAERKAKLLEDTATDGIVINIKPFEEDI